MNNIKKFFRISLLIISAVCLLTAFSFAQDNFILHEGTSTISENGDINLNTLSGDIQIHSWNKNEVKIVATGNQTAKDNLEVKRDNSPESVNFSVRKSKTAEKQLDNLSLKVEVWTPEKVNLALSTAGGDVEVNNIEGKVIATTAGGDISLKDIKGKVILTTAGGDINCTNYSGDIKATTAGGDIALTGSNGKIEAVTAGGNVNVEYSGKNEGIKLNTVGGNIKLKLPENFSANVKLSTFGGSVKCELNMTKIIKEKESIIEAEINGGGEEINCSTMGGNITIYK